MVLPELREQLVTLVPLDLPVFPAHVDLPVLKVTWDPLVLKVTKVFPELPEPRETTVPRENKEKWV